MDRFLTVAAADSAPTPPVTFHTDKYPSDNTVLPPFLIHLLVEELRNVVVGAGLTPDHTTLTQLRDAIKVLALANTPTYLGGPPPIVSNSTTVTLPVGLRAADTTSGELMTVTSGISILTGTSGANGLDTGSVANSTWYDVYVIKHGTTGTVAGLLTTSNSVPTLPSGYTHKRKVLSVLTDGSGDLVTGRCKAWPFPVIFQPDVPHSTKGSLGYGNLVDNGLDQTSFTALDLSSQVPPGCRYATLWVRASAALTAIFRKGDATHNGHGFHFPATDHTQLVPVEIDSSTEIDYKVDTSEIAVEVFDWTLEL